MAPLQLAKTFRKLAQLNLTNSKVLVSSVRHHWNKDFKPGPYPVTERERLEAAKRYGLDPSEYKAYPDDGTGRGDYPKVKAISGDSKDPYYPWDDPSLKRNFNEPMHAEFGLLREDRYDVNNKPLVPCWKQYLQFISVISGMVLLFWIGEHFVAFHPVVPKQYPKDGRKHYTFD